MTPSRVTQLKQNGMPVDSEESARAWIKANPTPQAGRNLDSPEALAAAEALISAPPEVVNVTADNNDPEVVLQRLRKSEFDAYSLSAAAHALAIEKKDASALPALIRVYSQTAANRLDEERKWERHRLKMGELVTVEFAKGLIQKILHPLEAQLHQLPKLAASSANPGDPVMAERAVEKALGKIFEQLAQQGETP